MATASELHKAIMEKCKDCTCHDFAELKGCTVKSCALWPFRLSKQLQKKEAVALGLEVKTSNRGRKSLSPEHLAKLKAGRAAKLQK